MESAAERIDLSPACANESMSPDKTERFPKSQPARDTAAYNALSTSLSLLFLSLRKAYSSDRNQCMKNSALCCIYTVHRCDLVGLLLQSSIYSKVLFFFLYYSLLYYYSFLSLLLNSFIFIFNLLFFLSFFGTQMLKEDRSKRRIKRFVTLHQCPSLHNSIYTSIESQLSILLFLHFGLAIVQYEITCDAIGAWGCGGCAGDERAERETGGSIRLPYIYILTAPVAVKV